MVPLWLMIAQGAKKIADNQNEQANTLNNQFNSQSNQPVNNGNAFSTISSVYNNYLSGDDKDKKKNLFGQLFNRF